MLRLPADCRSFIIFYYLTGCRSNSHFDYNAFSQCRDWLYMVMLFLLQLTQLSSQLSTKISTIKNLQISYIYNENRTTFTTFSLVTSPTLVPRVTHFRLSAVDTCTRRVPIFVFARAQIYYRGQLYYIGQLYYRGQWCVLTFLTTINQCAT